jgi:hypothetical protein
MSGSVSYRLRMGCGEPLQSRWWIAVMLRPAVAPNQSPTTGRYADKASGAGRSRTGCKS